MKIEHIAFNVADPVAISKWYEQHLGMKTVRALAEPPYTHFIADSAGQTVLEFYKQSAPVPDYFKIDPMVLHIAFLVKEIAPEQSRLLAAGATLASELRVTPAGDEMIFLHDPWGLTVQLIKRAQPLL